MPTRVARPARRSRPRRAAGADPAPGPVAVSVAAAVNPLRLPKYGRFLHRNAWAPLREQGYAAWHDPRREPVAALLLLALDRGWIAAAAVHAALDDPRPHEALHRLCATAWRVLPEWIEATARRHLLDPAQMPDWAPFVDIDWETTGRETRWALRLSAWWLHTFDLDRLPPALAVAIVEALDLIGINLTECGLLRDLAELWLDESIATHDDLQAAGRSDIEALWDHARTHTPYAAEYGWRERADFTAWWEPIDAFCAPSRAWLRRVRARRTPGDSAARLRRLTRRLWRWRRRGIGSWPWFRWLRRAVLTLRRCQRRWPEPPARAITLDAEDDGESLAYGQPIGFGEPWEEGVLDELNDFAQSGSGFAWFLRGDSGCWQDWRDALEHFAIGQGLLMGASQANAWTRNPWNTIPGEPS